MNNELTAALATIEKLRAERDRLAAENAGLKKFCKDAAFDADYEAELGMERGGFTDALNDIKTPATNAAIAGIKADGVEGFVSNTVHKIFDESDAWSALAYLSLANAYVKQLRGGAK